jgi:hypothetical protein
VGLIKTRPKVKVVAPAPLTPGQLFEATVIVIADRPVPVDAITVRLRGIEEITASSGRSTRTVVQLEGKLTGRTELKAGERRYPFTFRLPKDAPPSFEFRSVTVRYMYEVHVAIPWWPDLRAAFRAEVGFRDRSAPGSNPVFASSDRSGPKGIEPHLELSVDDDVLAAGDHLEGAIALGNSRHAKYRGIEVALVSYCSCELNGARREELRSTSATQFELPPPGHKTATFGRRLPRTLFPSWQSERWSVDWYVVATAFVQEGRDVSVRVPVHITPARHSQGRTAAPPVAGRARVDTSWRKVADKHHLDFESGALLGREGECEVAISRETNPRGAVLAAELIYPDLRLGLASQKKLLSGTEIVGRDASQTAWFNARLPKIAGLSLFVEDDRMRIEQVIDGKDTGKLSGFVRQALAIAAAVPKPENVPAARAHEPWLKTWRELAIVLEGKLNVGDLSARGRLGGCDVELWHHWPKKGKPSTFLAARAPVPLSTPAVAWEASGAQSLDPSLLTPEVKLRYEGNRVVAELPLQLDPDVLMPKLRALTRLAKDIRAARSAD